MDADLSFLLTAPSAPKRRTPGTYEEAFDALRRAAQALDDAPAGDPTRDQLAEHLALACIEMEPFLDDSPPPGAVRTGTGLQPQPTAATHFDPADAAEAARRRAQRSAAKQQEHGNA